MGRGGKVSAVRLWEGRLHPSDLGDRAEKPPIAGVPWSRLEPVLTSSNLSSFLPLDNRSASSHCKLRPAAFDQAARAAELRAECLIRAWIPSQLQSKARLKQDTSFELSSGAVWRLSSIRCLSA